MLDTNVQNKTDLETPIKVTKNAPKTVPDVTFQTRQHQDWVDLY